MNVLPGVNDGGSGVSCSLWTTPPVSIRLPDVAGPSFAEQSVFPKTWHAKPPTKAARSNDARFRVWNLEERFNFLEAAFA